MSNTNDQDMHSAAASELLPEGSLAARAAAWLTAHASEAYLVGGYIRDWLLGRESHDVDIAVAQDSLSLARRLADELEGYFVPLDLQRGIARVVCHEHGSIIYVDVTLLQGQTLAQDLVRRDFTINAMALPLGSETAQLVDPHDGRVDLARRLIRVVTPRAFAEDPLRLLRAVRLAAELDFEVEPHTRALIEDNNSLIRQSAAERIQYELVATLRTAQAHRWVRFLADTGLLTLLMPHPDTDSGMMTAAFEQLHRLLLALQEGGLDALNLQALQPFAQNLLDHISSTTSDSRSREDVLRIAALLCSLGPGDAAAALRALRFSSNEAHIGQAIVARWPLVRQTAEPLDSPRAIYRFFLEAGDAGIEVLMLALAQAQRVTERKRLAALATPLLHAYFHHHREIIAPRLLLDGHAVMQQLGLGPGPMVGEALSSLREAQAAGEVHTPQEARAFIGTWASSRHLNEGP